MAASQASRYRFVMAPLIVVAYFCVGLNVFPVAPVIPLIVDDLEVSRTYASLLVALPLLISAIFGLPGSVVVIGLGLKRSILIGWILMAVLALVFLRLIGMVGILVILQKLQFGIEH